MSSYYRVYRLSKTSRELVFATQSYDDAWSFVKGNGKRREYEVVRVTWNDNTDSELPLTEPIEA